MKPHIHDILKLGKEILEIPSPTGYSEKIIPYLISKLNNLPYEYEVTPKGNLLIHLEGNDTSKHVALSAHTDTLGLMVRSIQSNGTLKVTTLGGIIVPTLDGEYCHVITRDNKLISGTILYKSPSSHVYKDANSGVREVDNMIIRLDEVVKSKQDVEALGIQNGDIIAIDPKTQITPSGFIKSRFLDDKISVAILLALLEYAHKTNQKPVFNTTFIISTYEEVGHGTAWIPSSITEMIAVDMGCIGEDLACTEYDVSICAKDSSGPYDRDMITSLKSMAVKKSLNHVLDIYPMYGSDVSAALRGGANIKGALIGPGVMASHGMERTHGDAVEATFELLKSYLNLG
ncbi:MAG: M42 family metallopeptidase [Erysipelotrichia bacterium]|jgi:putative aminopeptidase FrvX|nr:M42 family metallopeptidase [Erysipelotrichia bacterium]